MTDLANNSSVAPTFLARDGAIFVDGKPLTDVINTVSPYKFHSYGSGKSMEMSFSASRIDFEGTPTAEQVGDAICAQLQSTVQIYRGLLDLGMSAGSVQISRSFTDKDGQRVPHLSVTAKVGRYMELEAPAAPAPVAAPAETLEAVCLAYFERHGANAPLAPASVPEAVQMAWYKSQMTAEVEPAPEAVEVEEAQGAIAEALIESGIVAPF